MNEDDKLTIDKSIFKNRLDVRNFKKNIHYKGKLVVVAGFVMFSSGRVGAIGLTRMPQPQITMMKP